MATVIKLYGLINGTPTQHDNEYVVDYSPEAANEPDEILLITTPDKDKATRFNTLEDALACYRHVDKRYPVRRDGRPNRPLTAFTAEFETIE